MYDGVIYESGEEWKLGDAIFFFAASKLLKDLVNQDERNNGLKEENVAENNAEDEIIETEDPRDYSEWIEEQRDNFHQIYRSIGNLQKAPKKLKDFLDRIDFMVYLPPSNVIPNGSITQADHQAHYIAVSLILKHYPNIRHVDSDALSILAWAIIRTNSNRQIERHIFNSSVPKIDRFCLCHLPNEFLDREEVKAKLEEIKKKGIVTTLIPIGKSAYD